MASKKRDNKVYTAKLSVEIEAESLEDALELLWNCIDSNECVVLDVVRITEK